MHIVKLGRMSNEGKMSLNVAQCRRWRQGSATPQPRSIVSRISISIPSSLIRLPTLTSLPVLSSTGPQVNSGRDDPSSDLQPLGARRAQGPQISPEQHSPDLFTCTRGPRMFVCWRRECLYNAGRSFFSLLQILPRKFTTAYSRPSCRCQSRSPRRCPFWATCGMSILIIPCSV